MTDMFPAFLPWNPPADGHLPGVRRQNAGKHFDCGGFPGAVRSDISDHFAALHGKAEIPDRFHRLFLPQQDAFLPLLPDRKGFPEMLRLNIAHASDSFLRFPFPGANAAGQISRIISQFLILPDQNSEMGRFRMRLMMLRFIAP